MNLMMTKNPMIKRLTLATLCGLQPFTALAQSALPPSAEPGNIQRDYLNRQDQPKPQARIVIPPAQTVTTPDDAEKLALTLKGITITGNTVFTEAELTPLYAGHLGQTLSLAEVYAIAQAITDKYRQAGYILSVATLPAQEITNGNVKIEIIEAYIADFTISGENLRTPLLDKFRDRAITHQPLHKDELEELLLILGNLPGTSITPVLMPSTAPGAIMLEVAMLVKPYQVSAGLNNRGSRYTGPFRQNARVDFHGLPNMASLKLAEETALPMDELKVLDLGYTLPLDAYGNTLELGATLSRSQPGYSLEEFDVESEGDTFRLGWQTPLRLTTTHSTYLGLTFEHTNAASTILGSPNSDDRLRVFEAALTTQQQHDNGSSTATRFALRQGIDAFGASEPGRPYLSRANGRSQFTSLKLDLQHWQPLTNRWSLQVGMTGQYAGAQLLASEEFAWGGASIGRAYDTAEFTGDHGLGGSLEVSYLIPSEPQNNASHQVYAFTDLGAAWKIDNNLPSTRTSGMTAGIGLRSYWGDHLNTQLEIAKPLTRPSTSANLASRDPRVFFSLQWRY